MAAGDLSTSPCNDWNNNFNGNVPRSKHDALFLAEFAPLRDSEEATAAGRGTDPKNESDKFGELGSRKERKGQTLGVQTGAPRGVSWKHVNCYSPEVC